MSLNFPCNEIPSDSESNQLNNWIRRMTIPFYNNYGEKIDPHTIEAYLEDVTDEETFNAVLAELAEHRPIDLASSDSLRAIRGDIDDIIDGDC